MTNRLKVRLTQAAQYETQQGRTQVAELLREARTEIFRLESKVDELVQAIKYTTDYLEDNPLNSIGYNSKAHREFKDVLSFKF